MNIDDLEGVVQDTTGDVIFNIRFDVIAFKPDRNEVLDGVVDSVDNTGIIVFSGPIKSYIKGTVSIFITKLKPFFNHFRE